MENLHSDLLEDILFRLPPEPALHAKRVCTTWRAILRNKTERSGFLFCFSHVYNGLIGGEKVRRQLFYEDEYDLYDHEQINYYSSGKRLYYYPDSSKIEHGRFFTFTYYPKDIIVGSCNGLVCFGKEDDLGPVPFLICNPLTGECVFLPEYDNYESPCGSVSSGFGYCPKTNKYKVVTIRFDQMNHDGDIKVYTVGECKWRYIGSISCFNRPKHDYSFGVYANGALYWLHECDSGHLQEEKQSQILALCLESETFRHMAVPADSHPPEKLLGGNNNLYLVYYTDSESSCTDIYVYKKNDINNSWIKEFSILWEESNLKSLEVESSFTPFAITRNNEVLLWDEQIVRHSETRQQIGIFSLRLCCYDPNTSTLNELWKYRRGRVYIEAIPHIQSVVYLKDLGETNVTYLKDSGIRILEANNFNRAGDWIPRRRRRTGRLRGSKRLKNC